MKNRRTPSVDFVGLPLVGRPSRFSDSLRGGPASAGPTIRTPAPRFAAPAFSLLEVVAAIGIFAVGMVAVLGLFTPVAKSVGSLADAEAAANVAALLNSKLQGQPFADVAALLKISTGTNRHQLTDVDATPNSTAADPRTDVQLLFASRDGLKIGPYDDPIWIDPLTRRPSDVEKYFEIALIRNEALLPLGDDLADPPTADPIATTLILPYSARIRWPAFVPDAAPANPRRALPAGFSPTGNIRFNNSQKQVLFFSGVLTR